jgi:hypothetical protein
MKIGQVLTGATKGMSEQGIDELLKDSYDEYTY